jgi:hypothetical protein
LRKIDRSAPWGVPRAAALGCGLVSGMQSSRLFSVEVAAKSFVLPRCSNFIFSRPHKLFRRAVFTGCWFPYGAIPARPEMISGGSFDQQNHRSLG